MCLDNHLSLSHSDQGFLYVLRPKSFLSTSLVKLHEILAFWLALLIDSEGFSDMTFSRIFWHFWLVN